MTNLYEPFRLVLSSMNIRFLLLACLVAALSTLPVSAQVPDGLTDPYTQEECGNCAAWNAAAAPFKVYGDTYHVGTRGLGAILITSKEGHVLIDGGLPDSAPHIIESVASLGFDVADVRLILNTHAHFDHAGGLAALQAASGAPVAASRWSAPVLESGRAAPDDPQFGVALDFPPVQEVLPFDYGDTLRVGPLALVGHHTAGHTPGGTSWSWRACEGDVCRSIVYADSQTPVSAEGFRFSDGRAYPSAVADFERGFAWLEQVSCDVLLTPHPWSSSMWTRLEGGPDGLVDPDACRRFAATARAQLSERLEREASSNSLRR